MDWPMSSAEKRGLAFALYHREVVFGVWGSSKGSYMVPSDPSYGPYLL